MNARTTLLLPVLAAVAGACGSPAPFPAGEVRATSTRIDSAVPRDEALRRFQQGIERADSLSGAARSRGALVRRFVRALEARDTLALRRLVLTRGEFAYLCYPANPQGLPPYELSPDLMWFLLVEGSNRGLAHALEERGGRPLGFVGHSCEAEPSRQGDNTVWGPCLVRRQEAGDTVAERLFGLIVERRGRYKFVSYANNL